MKYPKRVAGDSRNSAVSPMAIRRAAAAGVAGGASASEATMASPAAVSSASAASFPPDPSVASRWPGNGLAAGDFAEVSPSG